MEETISRMAGSQNGSFKTISQIASMAAPPERPLRQRTTTYGDPAPNGWPRLMPATACTRRPGAVPGLRSRLSRLMRRVTPEPPRGRRGGA